MWLKPNEKRYFPNLASLSQSPCPVPSCSVPFFLGGGHEGGVRGGRALRGVKRVCEGRVRRGWEGAKRVQVQEGVTEV